MKRLLIAICIGYPLLMFAHDGEEHGNAAKATISSAYFSSENSSEKYELLLKYAPIVPGKESTMRLFISDFNTNRPLDSVTLQVSVAGNTSIKVSVSRTDKGIYELKAIFPQKKPYNLVVSINGIAGVDLIQLSNIESGKELPVTAAPEMAHTHWYSTNWFFGLMGLLIGLIVMFFVRITRSSRITTLSLVLLCLIPVASYNPVSAHDGEEHGSAGGSKNGGSSRAFTVEKETQFLFSIQTQKIGIGDFNESTVLSGTVIAAPSGRAVIQSPQAGKIVSLRVTPGQQVGKGQVVAVVEQQIDAGTQISILSQSNIVNAEYSAAKAQYDRLKAIEDIAAKKDVTEAMARFETARRNKALFDANTGKTTGSTKLITLTSPVNGVVSTFNYAIGAVVNVGETLFEITDLNQVFLEAQVFSADVAKIRSAGSFTATSNVGTGTYPLKLISTAQSVNEGNQSQKVLFQIIAPNGQFKIGENVNVRLNRNHAERMIVIPNDAVTDINGKPAVFIKDNAERYSISFVVKTQSNDKMTIITKGVEEGERVVVGNVYQMKMMYLNQ